MSSSNCLLTSCSRWGKGQLQAIWRSSKRRLSSARMNCRSSLACVSSQSTANCWRQPRSFTRTQPRPFQVCPWKQKSFLSLHILHKEADTTIFITAFFLCKDQRSQMLLKHEIWAIWKKSETNSHVLLATTQSKKRCCTDSSSLQNRQVRSSTSLRLARLSLVKILLYRHNQRNTWMLWGQRTFHRLSPMVEATPQI